MIQELKCPFCGGYVRFTARTESIDEIITEAMCTCCGMEFRYTQNFAYSSIARIKLSESFGELWNRRARE